MKMVLSQRQREELNKVRNSINGSVFVSIPKTSLNFKRKTTSYLKTLKFRPTILPCQLRYIMLIVGSKVKFLRDLKQLKLLKIKPLSGIDVINLARRFPHIVCENFFLYENVLFMITWLSKVKIIPKNFIGIEPAGFRNIFLY